MRSYWALLAALAVLVAGCGGKANARSCAVYAADGSAEVRFAGAGAADQCRAVLHGVHPGDTTWTKSSVEPLTGHRDVTCRLSNPPLTVAILDTGLHTIGRPMCNTYAATGWR